MRMLLALLMVAGLATPAAAQERSPAQRETLTALARTLGEAQALRQVCAGAQDPIWRSRFTGMLDVEAPDEAFARQLNSAFDAGFAARRRSFVSCSGAAKDAEADVARHGRDLAAGLAQATIRVATNPAPDPDAAPVAETPAPR